MSQSLFKDKNGRVVIWQTPNLPLMLWAVLAVTSRLVHSPLAAWLATAFLFTWAFMEVSQGVNYFRRILGLLILAAVVRAHL
jgi:hypothetical protein